MDTSPAREQIRYAGRHRVVDRRTPSVAGYDVVELIGSGGSGDVWAATDAQGRDVAIKIVPSRDVDDALIELAVLGGLEDPHLVRLHESRELPSGAIALILEHCPGGSLRALVGARGHLDPGETVTVLSPIASTLGHLHGVGVVHGDVSPGNVLLDRDGRPLLADLGVARIAGLSPGEARGTDGFVAPEVALGEDPTAASDVFAVGALAWYCLTGEVPAPAVVRARLLDRLPDLPEPLAGVIESALRTRPGERPDADTMATALFESVPAQPIHLVQGSDDVNLLTRRIRDAARAQGSPGSAPSRGRPVDTMASTLLPRARTVLRGAGSGLRWVAPLVAVFIVVGAVTAGAMAWTGSRDDVRSSSRSGAADAIGRDDAIGRADAARVAQPSGGSTGSGSSPATDTRALPDAPRSDARRLVQDLADARARAWSAGTVHGLAEVDAPRSPAIQADTTLLSGVQLAGQRYVGLTFTAHEATLVSATKDRASIRTRIDTGPHVVTGPRGEERRPALRAKPVLLDVVRTPAGWRVHEVRLPPD